MRPCHAKAEGGICGLAANDWLFDNCKGKRTNLPVIVLVKRELNLQYITEPLLSNHSRLMVA